MVSHRLKISFTWKRYLFKLMEGMKRSLVIGATNREIADIEDSWKTHIMLIREMRKSGDAPVDSMGCHKLADPLAPPKTHRFQVLLALMLSSQTKDEITAGAMMRLRSHGCSVDSLLNISTSDLEGILHPVGFYKKKAIYIQKVAALLKEKYDGDVPDTVEELCSLPGVGPKMAHLVMQIAWGRVEGIAVDTHVHRIVNRLGWMKTNTPEKTRSKLQQMLPEYEWSAINPLLVGFGQQRCLPVKPKCDDCLCNRICPASTKSKAAAKLPVPDFVSNVSGDVTTISSVPMVKRTRTRNKIEK